MSEAIHSYLRRAVPIARQRQKIEIFQNIIDYLTTNPPYDWEVADCIETLALLRRSGRMRGHMRLSDIRKVFRPFLEDNRQPILRMATLRWFDTLKIWQERLESSLLGGQDWFSQQQGLGRLADVTGAGALMDTIQLILRDGVPSLAIQAAYISSRDGVPPGDLRHVSHWAGPTFRHYGLTSRSYPPRVVEDVLGRLFRVATPPSSSIRTFLGQRFYKGAARHLLEAEASYYQNHSRYVAQLNNFNQLILTKLLPKYISSSKVKPESVFGLLNGFGLDSLIPAIYAGFKECNELRRRSPEPHAYAKDY